VVLSALEIPIDVGKPNTHAEDAVISIFREAHGGLSLIWRSTKLTSIEHRQYHSVELWPFAMTGRNIPELVFIGPCTGGSATPTRVLIYRWTGKTFRNVLDTSSPEQSVWIEDLRHDGHYQVRCVELVGKDMSHGDQVRWATIYDWNGTEFANADAKYPSVFRKTKSEILDRLTKHPHDPVLLKYLGKQLLAEGKQRQGLAALRKMQLVCLDLIKHDSEDINSWWNLGEYARITHNGRRAIRCFQHVQRMGRALAHREPDADDQDYYYRFVKDATKQIQAIHKHP